MRLRITPVLSIGVASLRPNRSSPATANSAIGGDALDAASAASGALASINDGRLNVKRRLNRLLPLTLLIITGMTALATAIAQDRVDIRFKPGATSTTINGTIHQPTG